ncbi:hypothetical protein HG536_0E01880 [Torulaspora globosa]|uniref:Uncharacterized protein n=1 Tax=Torulaspora globosa TaxID=48254 RepID=A0A7G3ZIE1_9SACH|nr:uncharacterized protein HG536_0E01880 [Torulaspora globosa]QLL33277.1 hypothetical protein HG536_0E01880 [Torulaspora globosa]
MPLGQNQSAGAIEKDNENAATITGRPTPRHESNQEVRLFHSLNQFIELVSNEPTRAGTRERRRTSDKYVSNFLRLNLLSYLRQLQQHPESCEGHREVLIQWWVTLLNFLNSDLIPNQAEPRTSSTQLISFPDPLLSIETVSVCLESVSRLMSSLMILPKVRVRHTEIYSHHILLTIHYVTNRLILIAKSSKQPMNTLDNQSFLQFLNSYSSLLRSFLGKLNAYAFFYLPDEFHFDTQALLAITPDVTFQHSEGEKIFSWKKRSFSVPKNARSRLDPKDLDNRDTKFFKIVASYLRNDSVLMAFYWHYWYIVLRYLAKCEPTNDRGLNLDLLPGASILLEHVTCMFLRNDLNRFTKFVQSTNKTKSSNNAFNVSDTMPDSSAASTDVFMTNEMLNEFVFTNFSILRLWECLRSLAGCFQGDPNMSRLLRLHDLSQLKHVAEISAYDHSMANVIYNKTLQFVVFQFESYSLADFLNWDIWCRGIVAMLRTLNGNCQVVALLCLFNNWEYMLPAVQNQITTELLENLWFSLTTECDFQLSKVLFFKLLVFRVIPSADHLSKEVLKKRLESMFDEMCFLDNQLDQVDRDRQQDVLLFYGNRKFFLVQSKPREEEELICRAEREPKSKAKRPYQNFPSVLSTANVRPSLILKGGRYPYDVFDEMVVKAALMLAEKRRRDSETPLPTIEDPSSRSINESTSNDNKSSKSSPSISSALGSWFSKLSTTTDNRIRKLGSSQRRNSEKSAKAGAEQAFEIDVSLPSCHSTDMLSMYSTVSSLATGRTIASDEQLGNSDRNTSEHTSKAASRAAANSEKLQPDQRKKKKLLSPVELKYTSGITGHATVTTLFKALNVPCESMLSKVEKANVKWSVVTAKTYDKPLPKPADMAVETFIEDMRNQSLQSFEDGNIAVERLHSHGKSSNESTLLSNFSDNSFLPRPDYSILALGNENVSTNDSELAARVQKLTLDASLRGDTNCVADSFCNDREDEKARTLKRNRNMQLETRITKLSTLLRMFNQTVEEYYEHQNFINHGSIFIEFELKAHLGSQYTPDQFKRSI